MDTQLKNAIATWSLENPCPLQGDVGTRRYFRVTRHVGDTAVLVLYPDRVEEADDAFEDFRSLHVYLDPILRVPKLHLACDVNRAMLLEDVGDYTLEAHLGRFPHEELHWAEKVAWELSDWIDPLTMAAPADAAFMRRSFDMAKFEFEWSHCKQHFFKGLLKKNPPLWLDRMMDNIHRFLVPRAKYLAHRDFHVRNLMVCGLRPVTIDFQDARLAPGTYDLASVLFDGYYEWDTKAKEILVAKVMARLGLNSIEFWSELNAVALQRNFKALGTFACQLLAHNKLRYAPAIPRTLNHIQGHFERIHHGEGTIQLKHWKKVADNVIQGLVGGG